MDELEPLDIGALFEALKTGAADKTQLFDAIEKLDGTFGESFQKAPEGRRNAEMVRVCGLLRRHRIKLGMALFFVHAWNDGYCVPPLPRQEVDDAVRRFWVTWAEGDMPLDTPGRDNDQTITEAMTWSDMEEAAEALGSTDWLVENFILTGGLHFISAQPGHGKSWILYDLIRATLTGEKWLGEFPVAQQNVLLVDEEMGVGNTIKRLKRLALTSGNTDGFRYLGRTDMDFGDPVRVQQLLDLCKRYDTKLLCVDSLVRVHKFDENSNTDMRRLYKAFNLFMAEGITLVILHHDKKPSGLNGQAQDSMRGAGEIGAMNDASFSVTKQPDATYKMLQTKTRHIADDDKLVCSIEIEDDGGFTTVKTIDAAHRSVKREKALESAILEALEAQPDGWTVNALVKHLKRRKDDVSNTLEQLKSDGLADYVHGARQSQVWSKVVPEGLF